MVKIALRTSISTKIFVMSILTGIVMLAAYIFFSTNIFYSVFDDLYKENALSITHSLSAGIDINNISDHEKLQTIIHQFIFIHPDIYQLNINVVDENNELFTDASNDTTKIHQPADEDNIQSFSNDTIFYKKITLDNGDFGLKIITPAILGGQKIGTYEIYLSNQRAWNAFRNRIIIFLTLISIFVILVSFVFYLFVRKTIIHPIGDIIFGVDQVGNGNLDYKIPLQSSDEIGKLAQAFNDNSIKISNFYHNMEQMVASRTMDLNLSMEKMEDTKSAILNILEDDKELQNELKAEKEGVENKVIERTDQLNSEKIKLTASMASLPVGFAMIDISHNVLFINNNALSILGLTKSKVRVFDDILHQFSKTSGIYKMHDDYHKEKMMVGKSHEFNFGTKILNVSLYPMIKKENGESEVLGSILLLDDITEAKILDRSKDEFFSIASHELRTPLTAIRGNTSMILEYYSDAVKEPELKAMIDDIHESSIRLINIVNDFLNVSRLEQNKMVYDIKEINLNELIPEVIKEYGVTGSQKKLNIEYLKPSFNLPMVMSDIDKVRQIIINLVGNALKFTEKGGITITPEVSDKFVKVLITDTGRGISQKEQGLLFRKFQQAGSSIFTRDTAGGTGLGLYISKMMAEGMGGELKLEKSEVNKGSTFSISLPVAKKENKVNHLAKRD